MPYTPPGRSPADSRPQTPRSNSFTFQEAQPPSAKHVTSKDLPHSSTSTAYLSKQRRSPPVSQTHVYTLGSAQNGSFNPHSHLSSGMNGMLSPPSVRNESMEDSMGSPSGSPPSSSDDEPGNTRGRLRDVANLAELQAAIRIIEQHRQGSPDDETRQQTLDARSQLGLQEPRIHPSTHVNGGHFPEISTTPPLSQSARKISHSRSSTETSAFLDFPRNRVDSPGRSRSVSDVDDEEDEEEEPQTKPALIRKKSGELVRPALRASSTRRRPSSMPGTPTYSKAVHFQDNSLEHVRHFLQVDRPIAVSAGSSPVEAYEDESEFPFNEPSATNSPSFEWEIKLTNFPPEHNRRLTEPIRVERVYLSTDTKVLIGAVAVRNLAFHKFVVARFTLDYWKTTSEVVAEYNNDVRKKFATDGYDRFTFSVKLEDQANLENKTMFFCVRYNVNGREYWDNNGSHNYQVDFSKKFKPPSGKQSNSRSLNGLPRSRPSTETTPKLRPRSMPSFDDFSTSTTPYDFSSFPHPSTMVGETPIKFRNNQSPGSIIPDAPGKPRNPTNQQAFGNRYNFGASLSAAIQAASKEMGEKGSPRPDRSPPEGTFAADNSPPTGVAQGENLSVSAHPNAAEVSKPKALTSEKPSLQSPSYHELLDKYCFFGSGKATTASTPKTRVDPDQLDPTPNEVPQALPSPSTTTNKASDSSASTPIRSSSPSILEGRNSKSSTTRASRSTSPATGSALGQRAASPAAFGYPYHQRMKASFFETQTPTAIQG